MALIGYERYQLEWMIAHGYSLKDLVDSLGEYTENSDLGIEFGNWVADMGFNGDLWVCKDEYEHSEVGKIYGN